VKLLFYTSFYRKWPASSSGLRNLGVPVKKILGTLSQTGTEFARKHHTAFRWRQRVESTVVGPFCSSLLANYGPNATCLRLWCSTLSSLFTNLTLSIILSQWFSTFSMPRPILQPNLTYRSPSNNFQWDM